MTVRGVGEPKPIINIIVNVHVILDAGLPHGAHERVDIRNAADVTTCDMRQR